MGVLLRVEDEPAGEIEPEAVCHLLGELGRPGRDDQQPDPGGLELFLHGEEGAEGHLARNSGKVAHEKKQGSLSACKVRLQRGDLAVQRGHRALHQRH